MDNNIKLQEKNPKLSANIVSNLTFVWMIKWCYKCVKESVKVSDLYENLPTDKSDKLSDTLEDCWNDELKIAKHKATKPSLFRAIRKAFFLRYMFQGVILFFYTVIIRPIQPVILSIFIGLFSESEKNEDDVQKEMYIYGGSIVAISFVLLFFEHNMMFRLSQTGMRIRIACCSLIYRKMLKLSKKSLHESAVGQIVNLLSNDVSRFDLMGILFHQLWIMPIQSSLITYLLWRQVEYAALVGVGSLILLTIPVHIYVGKVISGFRLKIAQRTDNRVKKMTEIISGIQVIKMYGWEKPFAKVVNDARIKEIKIVTWASYVRGIVTSSAVFIERSILFITVISYVLFGNAITADKVFSMAQFFNLLQLAMAIYFPLAISTGAETLISIKRLQKFLMMEEKQESIVEKNISNGISLRNISASWVPDTKFLNGIDMQIPVGALCAIIGPVGAGKSSVLQLLLGELKPEKGSIDVCGDISYSSQEAWLFASTVRKNILFGQQYDAGRYRKVIKVCALERDFELLPYGDKTLVGDRGVSLSGGQKARINLARAVYRQADIYLLDDPLSAVDTHVGKHLFEECIVGYMKNKTRVLVTHQLQYLKKADHIIVINDGKIQVQGSFDELSKSDFDFAKMLIASDESDATEENSNNNELVDSVPRKGSLLSFQSQTSVNSVEKFEESGEEEKENEETSVKMGASAYIEYAKAGGNACTLFLVAFLFIAGQATSNCTDLWVTFWTQQEAACHINYYYHLETQKSLSNWLSLNKSKTDQNAYFYKSIEYETQEPGCEDSISVNLAIYVYTGLICACIITLSCRSIYYYRTAMNASRNLHNKMFSSLLLAPMRFFDINPSGRILNRFSRDIGMIDELLPRIILDASQIFLVMIGILVMVFITNVYMIAIAAILAIMFYKMRGWYVIIARDVKHLEGITKSPVFSHINATLNGISTIRASYIEPTLKKEFDLHQDTHTSAWYLMLACMSSFGLWMDLLSFIFVACVTFGFIILSQVGSVNGSQVGLAVSQSLILTGMVQYGMRQAAEVVSQMTSVERVLEYTKLDKEEPQETPAGVTIPKVWPDYGKIEFQKVYLRYSEDEAPVLKNLNFMVKAGEKVGIVGRTGAGKSSLISALFKLASIEGSITIDDIDTQTIGLNELRKKISIIPQEPVLFSATLRYNLDPFGEFLDEDLWKALEEVELKDVAESLDFFVYEGGSNFSVGQRQLLCLARAILRNNKILVLDEATANVDPKTDALIQKTIRNKFSECTVLTIAHRLHTIMDSDKVLVMDAGSMVEYDHPHRLLQNANGYLYSMVDQTGPAMAAQLHSVTKETYSRIIKEEE